MLRDAPEFQSLWGDLIVEELIRNGVDQFIVCPGSRSTPLVQAIARHPRAHATVWLDERGAAFHALGRARASTWPACVVTTSGTAVANLLPAVIEASLDGIPLMLLTADRPPELREVGANQSIRQMSLFADHVRWSFDLPTPSPAMPARALLTTVDHAARRALGGRGGPVQINCPFREPLGPAPLPWDAAWLEELGPWLDGGRALVSISTGELVEELSHEEIATRIRAARRGIIVCASAPLMFDPSAVRQFAAHLGWPLWADVRSGLRLGPQRPGELVHLDRLLEADGAPRPDVVLQFGGRLTSKRLQALLDRGEATTYVLVEPAPTRMDPGHRVTHRVIGDTDAFCELLAHELPSASLEHAPLDLGAADDAVEAATTDAVEAGEALSEPWVLRWLSAHMRSDDGLFLSNSMPIRDAQRYGVANGPALVEGANRGASGIDGIVSTAAGFAQGLAGPATLVVGDLAFLHDVNALAMLRPLEHPLTIVVLNNGGGSIFSFLPIAEHEDVLTPLVNTPHDLTFDGICASFQVPYARVTERSDFAQAYRDAIDSSGTSVIEVASSLAGNKAHHDRIEAAIDHAVAKALAEAVAKDQPRA